MDCLLWFILTFFLSVPFVELLLRHEVVTEQKFSKKSLNNELLAVFALLGIIAIWRLFRALIFDEKLVALVWITWVVLGFFMMIPQLKVVFYRSEMDSYSVPKSAPFALRFWAYSFIVAMVIATCLEGKM